MKEPNNIIQLTENKGDMWSIAWRNTQSGRAGKGTKRFSLVKARQLAAELNRDYPHITHTPELC